MQIINLRVNSTNHIDTNEVSIQCDISMSKSGSELNPNAHCQPYVPQMHYIESPDGIVRVDKGKSGGNEGVTNGLVESVHALVQVVLNQHEVNHPEPSYRSSEPENER